MALNPDQARRLAEAYTNAWNTGSPDAVASFFAPDGTITINRGTAWRGRAGVAEMAAGFHADIPDLSLRCDGIRVAGDHVVYLWTFTGTHAGTGRRVSVSGWEEWDIDAAGKVSSSLGWYDAEDYARQTSGAA